MDIPRRKPRSGNPWLVACMVLLVIAALIVVLTPLVQQRRKMASLNEATSNARSVFYLLVEFDSDYGEFPSDATAALIMDENEGSDMNQRQSKGEYSNDYLGQFIAGGYTNSEEVFFAELRGMKKPDNVISPPEKLLEAGECGFAYVKNQSTKMNAERPVLISPMFGEGLKCDPDLFNGTAMALRIDGSVKTHLINKERKVLIGDGKTLFQTGPGTVWEKEGFDPSHVVFPEPMK